MNVIQESMKNIRASEELKRNTLHYLDRQKKRAMPGKVWRYAAVAACLFLFLTAGGFRLYAKPVSYISIDVNPSIELGINRFGRVVSADAYNTDGQDILEHVKLKNMSYSQAIDKLLQSEDYAVYLTEGSHLVFTVISERSDAIMQELNEEKRSGAYQVSTYSSDMTCREEAHQHEMSFGKYRACQELAQYDETVTIEDCHGMTMGEICDNIKSCKRYHHGRWRNGNSENNSSGDSNSGNGNSGNGNSGNSGSGNGNSGDGGSGNGNSGNSGSGNGNSGNGGSGNDNSGNGNSGNSNSGDGSSGNGNSANSSWGNGGGQCNGSGRHHGRHHGNGY